MPPGDNNKGAPLKRIFHASCALNGSPGPMPGAQLPAPMVEAEHEKDRAWTDFQWNFDVEGTNAQSIFTVAVCSQVLRGVTFLNGKATVSLALLYAPTVKLLPARSTGSEAFVSAYRLLKRLGFLTVRLSYPERNRKRRLPPRVDTFFPSSNSHNHAAPHSVCERASERRRRDHGRNSGRTQLAARRRPPS